MAGAGIDPAHVVDARVAGDLFVTLGVYRTSAEGSLRRRWQRAHPSHRHGDGMLAAVLAATRVLRADPAATLRSE
jgi:hypothetical protein